MTQSEVAILMMESTSEEQWDANCDRVKKEHGGQYPDFWFAEVIASGLYQLTRLSWSPKEAQP